MTDEGAEGWAKQELPASAAAVSGRTTPRARGRFPSRGLQLVVIICLALVLVLRQCGAVLEYAAINIATAILFLIAACTLLIGFVVRSGYSPRFRYGVGGAVLGLVVLLAVLVRVEHVTGELVPKFKFRWQRHPDELLEKPTAQEGGVDLARTTPHDFPQFLGPERAAAVSGVTLARDWTAKPPRQLWRSPIGAGWSGFVVVNGFAVTMEQRGPEELVTCYEAATGNLKWLRAVPARHATIPGGIGPRSTPTIHGGRVYALGATGVLQCLDGATGNVVWKDDLLQRIGISAEADEHGIAWGRAASPLIVDDLVVVPLGGKAEGPWVSLVAYRQATGQVAWTAGTSQAGYSSPRLATLLGVRQIVVANQDTVTGHRPETGEVLWEYAWAGKSNMDPNVSDPVALPNDCLLLSKGYGGGGRLLQGSRTVAGVWQWREVWANRRVLKTKYTNPVIRGEYAYALSDGVLECVRWATGQPQWRGGRYGPGQLLAVGELLLVQAEDGRVILVEATPEAPRELGVLAALTEKTWNTLCLSDHLLLVRNAEEAAGFELP